MVWSVKLRKIVENVRHNFSKPQETCLNFLLCLTSCPKPKSQFTPGIPGKFKMILVIISYCV